MFGESLASLQATVVLFNRTNVQSTRQTREAWIWGEKSPSVGSRGHALRISVLRFWVYPQLRPSVVWLSGEPSNNLWSCTAVGLMKFLASPSWQNATSLLSLTACALSVSAAAYSALQRSLRNCVRLTEKAGSFGSKSVMVKRRIPSAP